MPLILLALFIGVPLLEIAVFIEVGGWIGLWATLAIVVATAIAGSAMLRIQGLNTLHRAQEALQRGEMPLSEVFDGACLLLAGALLLTPGFVTDSVGGLLFVPGLRRALRRGLGSLLRRHGHVALHRTATRERDRPPGTVTIEGEYEEVADEPVREEEDDREDRPGRGWRP